MKKILILMMSLMLINSLAWASGDTEQNEGNVVADYPNKVIDVYVGHGAGGGTDSFVRMITSLMAKDLDANFNVLNQPGGSGVVAMKTAMQKKADGYTIIGDSAYSVTTAAGTNPYGLDKVIPIARCQSDIYALQVKAGTFESIEELVQFAKENPNTLKFGAVGSMGMDEINARRFMQAAGVEMLYIPEEGAGTMHSDLLGGHIDVMLEEIGPVVSYVESGEYVPLVVFTDERLKDYPNVPTTIEKGWDLTDGIERYLMISKDAPKEIVEILEASAKRAMATDEYKEYAHKSYLDLRDGWMNSEDFTKKLAIDVEKYKDILNNLGN